jgi:RNA polymerase sigma-70 factor (ECF subfamily)
MELYQKQVYRIVRRILINPEETDDVVQEVFIKVWNKLAEFRTESRLSTWLYRIAVNEALSHLRQKRRVRWLDLGESERYLSQQLAEHISPDLSDVERKLQFALLSLPERQRTVFQLRYHDEMPYQEMSKLLGVTEGALKASYHHAVQKIERILLSN